MEQFISIISNLGFPIAITFYLLTRFEKKLDKLSSTVEDLDKAVQELRYVIKQKK